MTETCTQQGLPEVKIKTKFYRIAEASDKSNISIRRPCSQKSVLGTTYRKTFRSIRKLLNPGSGKIHFSALPRKQRGIVAVIDQAREASECLQIR